MSDARRMRSVIRFLALSSIVTAGGCASVEYRVPTWEVQRLTQVAPAMRGGAVRVVPAYSFVPAPASEPVTAPPPPEEVAVGINVDVDVPVVVGTAPRPVPVRPQVGAPPIAKSRPAAPAGGGFKTSSASSGGWKAASTPARPAATHVGSRGGGRSGGGGGGSAAGVAAGAEAAADLLGLVADAAAASEVAAEAASLYDGWVAVDPNHLVRLYYGSYYGWRAVPLSRLVPADLVGLQYAKLNDGDGRVMLLQQAPVPAAAPPPEPQPLALPPGPATARPPIPAQPPTAAPAPTSPPVPVPQVTDPESP